MKIKTSYWNKTPEEATKYTHTEAHVYGFLAILNGVLFWHIAKAKWLSVLNLLFFLHCFLKIISINQWRKQWKTLIKSKQKHKQKE